MALNMKFAEGIVELSVSRQKYDSDMAKVRRELTNMPGRHVINLSVNAAAFRRDMVSVRQELAKLKTFQIGIRVDRSRATADINLLRQQINSVMGRRGQRISFDADLARWRRSIVQVFTDLQRVRLFASTIPIKVNATPAHASVNLLIQQLRAAQAAANFGKIGSLFSGGGGSGRSAGGGGRMSQLSQGLGMGLGIPMMAPQAMAGLALGVGAYKSVQTSAELESELVELRRITGMSGEQTGQYEKSLFDLAQNQPGVGIRELITMSQIGGRAGVADKEGPQGLLRFTKDLAMVRNVINDIPAEELAESITKVLNVFGEGTNRVAGFGSALAKMDSISVASARDILQISQEFSGTAASLKMTIPQVLAFSSVLKDVGLSNAQASGSYNQILRVMASEHEKIANLIGVTGDEFKKAYETDALSALDMVIAKLKTLESTVEAQEFLKDLGFKGVRSGAAISQLASMNDEVRRRTAIAAAETGSLETLRSANTLKGGTVSNQFTRAGNAVVDLAKATGDRLAPMASKAAWGLAEVATGLASIVRGTNQVSFAGERQPAQAPAPAALPTANPAPPLLTLEEAQKAEDKARTEYMDLRFEAEEKQKEAARLGYEGRQAMLGAAGRGPAALAQAEAAVARGQAATTAAKTAADAMQRAGVKLEAIVEQRFKLTDQEEAKARDERFSSGLMGAINSPSRMVGGLMAAGQFSSAMLNQIAESTPNILKLLPKKKEHTYSSGLSGEEVGRQLQDAALNMMSERNKDAAETAKNTAEASRALKDLVELARKGGGGLIPAIFGR